MSAMVETTMQSNVPTFLIIYKKIADNNFYKHIFIVVFDITYSRRHFVLLMQEMTFAKQSE